jgi:hypothetical protein
MPRTRPPVAVVLSPATPADAVAIDALVRAGRGTTVGVGVHFFTREVPCPGRWAVCQGRPLPRTWGDL